MADRAASRSSASSPGLELMKTRSRSLIPGPVSQDRPRDSDSRCGVQLSDAVGQLGAESGDLAAGCIELGGRGAAGLEQRSHVHETLQLQDEVVDQALFQNGHAASSCGTALGAISTSVSGGFDSSSNPATTAP